MYLKKKTIVKTRNKRRPQKTLIILILLCGIISCKSSLIVYEIKTDHLPNPGNFTFLPDWIGRSVLKMEAGTSKSMHGSWTEFN